MRRAPPAVETTPADDPAPLPVPAAAPPAAPEAALAWPYGCELDVPAAMLARPGAPWDLKDSSIARPATVPPIARRTTTGPRGGAARGPRGGAGLAVRLRIRRASGNAGTSNSQPY